jgi:ribosomal protein S8
MYQLQYFITTLNLSLKQNKSFFIVTKTKFILQLIKLLIKNKYFIGYKLHKHKKLIVFFKLNLSCGQPLMRTCNLISTLGCRIFVKYNQ